MKKFLRCIAKSLILVSAVAFLTTLYRSVNVSADGPSIEVVVRGKTPVMREIAPAPTVPEKIKIPVLGVNADVQKVGIARSGNMAVPSNFSDAGWYKYGPAPGSKGNAVLAGHLDNALGLPGVFKRLEEIKEGDDIYVIDVSGTIHHFVVDSKESLSPGASTTRIFAESDTSRLVLITCEGAWDQSVKGYTKRLVVYATLVD